MANLLPASVDTITTRFLMLFIFLLFIPLCTLIIFTLNVLAGHLEQMEDEQLRLSQDLFTQAQQQTEEALDSLSLAMENQLAHGAEQCLHTRELLCLRLSRDKNILESLPSQAGQSVRKLSEPAALKVLEAGNKTDQSFLVIFHHTLYLIRKSSISRSQTDYFYGLPLDESLLNGIYKNVTGLETSIWILSLSDTKATWLAQNNSLQVSSGLKKILLTLPPNMRNSPSLALADQSFRLRQQTLFTIGNQPIARVLHILPIKPYQDLLSNYYVGIYLIMVASLLFSVVLAMLAGRTITQPLLKLIRQLKTLNRESVMKESDQIQVGGVLEIQQLGEAFNHMILRLRQEHKLKDNFVATLTHDLKVPLLAEKQTLSYFLKEAYGPLNPEQAEVLSILKSSNQSCLSLVTGLLEVYRYESGEVSLLYERFHLGELLEKTISECNALAQEKSIQLNLQYALTEQSTLIAYADPMEIKRVLHNLISNAITNTPVHGKIDCKIVDAGGYGSNTVYKISSFQYTSLKHPVKLDDKLLVVIQDSGIGFSNDDLNHLFKQFAASKGRNPMSIGLGLFNCYQVLKAHCNPLWVESTEGEGAAVNFLVGTTPQLAQDRRMSGDRRQGA